jgi:hypothetical protein
MIARVQDDQSVIASGIVPGDVVVTDGQLRLTPNARVAPRNGGAGNAVGASAERAGGSAGGAATNSGRGAAGEAR